MIQQAGEPQSFPGIFAGVHLSCSGAADVFHAYKRDAAGAYDGEITRRAGLWLVGPDLSLLLCEGGCIFLCLVRRASAGHKDLPDIPDHGDSALVYSFFFMVTLPDFNL